MHRREFVALFVGAATISVLTRAARAPGYPSRPVRIVSGFAAGGAGDVLAPIAAQALTQSQLRLSSRHRASGGHPARAAHLASHNYGR